MKSIMIVEVVPDSTGALPRHLIHEAYRASRLGLVTLVLRGTTVDAMNRALDPVVLRQRRDVHGVRYVNSSDIGAITIAAHTARIAVGESVEFLAVMSLHGIPCLAPPVSGDVLEMYCEQHIVAPTAPLSAPRPFAEAQFR